MTFVHTAHGPGRIIATETMRGRTRHKVAGAGFEVWLDSTQVRTSTLGDINEDNSTTLPYDPEPQYPSDMWSHDSTIQPGEQEIDADERLSASDSLDFDSASERPYPGPNPDLFAKEAKVQPWTNDDWEKAENHDPTDRYRNHPDSWSHKPTEQDYADWESKNKEANLGPKFASWMLEAAPEGDDSISRFKRDPQQEINRLGYLWTGGVEEPQMAEYGQLVEADKQLRTAAWADVRQKAQRLRREGRVHVLHKAPGNIYANVDGDHGTYSVLISKTGFNSQSIDKWACSCEWGKWAFQRKISYVGRLCSHGYASYLEMQSSQHKGNPGRFHHPFDPGAMSPRKRKTSSCVDSFQDYVEDYRDGHVDIDAADNFISMPTHDQPLSEDEVNEVYDWVRDNHTEREPRDYKKQGRRRTAAESSDGTKVLRTQPHGMTPDLIKVPGPQPSYFVDVEEDERETTGPGQTVVSMVDAQGNRYSPASLWRTADEAAVAPEDDTQAAPQVSSPDVATPRIPEAAPQKEEEATTGSSAMGGFDMSDFANVATPVIDGVSQFAAPIAQGIGSAIGGIFSSRTAEYYMDGPTNADTPSGEIDHLRELSAEEPDYRDRDTQNRGVRDAVDYLREEGFDASPIVARRQASYGLGNQDAAPPGGAYWQPGGGSWADGVFSGSGPDPKFWRGTSEDLIDRGDSDIDEVDVTEGSGETNHWDESDRPAQGKNARRRYAEDLHEEPDFFSEDGGRKSESKDHEYEPDMSREGRRFYADEEEVRNNLIQSVGEEIEGIGLYNDFLDDAEDAGDEEAAEAIEETIHDEYKHVDQFSDALERQGGKHDADPEMPWKNQATGEDTPTDHWENLHLSPFGDVDDYKGKHRAEAGMNDVVRQFQASGGGALAGSGGGGGFGDDDIAGQARKFLAKTAGRVYSLAEQQELVDESHPQGARNKPNEDDLAGTHYV